jgi:hypothetical protein
LLLQLIIRAVRLAWPGAQVLGIESHDIDIALDDCKGVAFAEHVNEYLVDAGESVRSIGVVSQGVCVSCAAAASVCVCV